MKIITDYKVLLEGNLIAEAVVSKVPLSFWGGVDVQTGKILDIHSDIKGEIVKDKILCIPYDRGSCSGSGVLIEMVRERTAPKAILCIEAEPVLALGPLIGEKMYGHGMALRQISETDYNVLKTGDIVSFEDKEIIIQSQI